MTKKLIITIYVLTIFFSFPAHSKNNLRLFETADRNAMNRWVDSVFNKMTDDEKIGQLFMIVADPASNTKNINSLISAVKEEKIGGILFQKGNPESQLTVTNRLQREAKTPLMIALDGEWGLSMRLSNTTRFPKNMMLGAITNNILIEQYGEEVGRQCREMGIHVNFAPDIDVNNNANNPVIGIRSFGEDPENVAKKAIAYSRGLEKAGVISVAKHFPGHGDTNSDSHNTLPVIEHNRKRLYDVELRPFKKYIDDGLSGIMVAHLDIPALGTNGLPSSMSSAVVTGLLRDELDFKGLCFTDGLAMKGADVGRNSTCVQALKAGNDILLGPVNLKKEIEAVKQAIKKKVLSMADIEDKCRRILCYKFIAGLNNVQQLSARELDKRLNTPHADWLNAKLNEEAITIVKNEKDIIPVKNIDRKRIASLSIGDNTNTFQYTLNKYKEIDNFKLSVKADSREIKNTFNKLKNYDLIICGIHNQRAVDGEELQALTKSKDVILVFFTIPYKCTSFYSSIKDAKGVIIAYEPVFNAERFAAQAVFGGIEAKGELPVTVPGLFAAGSKIKTDKIRLGFHEPEEVNINPCKLHRIDSIIIEGLEKEAYPGGQVLIAKDGMIIYNKTFGYLDYSKQQKVTASTIYDLASVSKATGTLLAVMKSYDNDNFLLTQNISKYIKELNKTDKKDITVRELLFHQSGLTPTIPFYEQAIDKSSYTGSLYSRKRDVNHNIQYDARTYVNNNFKFNPDIISKTSKKGFTNKVGEDLFISDSFVNDSIISGIIQSKAGTKNRYVYSCINFILLKIMVEKQSGESMDKYLDKNFFEPLGASTTTYNPLNKFDSDRIAPTENERFIRNQIIKGYVHDEAAAFQGGVSGNAGLFSDANDLAKILQLYLNQGEYGGERYLSKKTCKLFTESKSTISRRGLGFDKPDIKNKSKSPCGNLTPGSVYGHTGFTGTCFWIDPTNNLIYIFLSNRTFPSRTNAKLFSLDIRTNIQDAIYRAIE
jgi:beta-glucosidase-like glycosyl hydrolase/CubicO group peptidase (beta-lactamase class C family)